LQGGARPDGSAVPGRRCGHGRSGRCSSKEDAKLDIGVVAGVIDVGQGAGGESVGLLTPGSGRLSE
jgi:hypothetical protein